MTIDINGGKDFIFPIIFSLKKNLYFEELTKILKNTDHLLLDFRGFANFMHSFIYSFFSIQLILAGPTVCRTLSGVSGAE